MAQRAASIIPPNLILRTISAGLLAPPFFASIYFGSPWFDIVIIISAVIMNWEWTGLCFGKGFHKLGLIILSGIFTAVLSLYLIGLASSLFVLVLHCSFAIGFFVITKRQKVSLLITGNILLCLFCISFLWLRSLEEFGRDLMIWLVLAVWFTDIGGFLFGKIFGGKKLMPNISPNKTWSGIIGAILLCGIWGQIWLFYFNAYGSEIIIIAGFFLAVFAQIGDLSVSFFKRRVGVKDSSKLIPGHGGVLDRLDGLFFTIPMAYFIFLLYIRYG